MDIVLENHSVLDKNGKIGIAQELQKLGKITIIILIFYQNETKFNQTLNKVLHDDS